MYPNPEGLAHLDRYSNPVSKAGVAHGRKDKCYEAVRYKLDYIIKRVIQVSIIDTDRDVQLIV